MITSTNSRLLLLHHYAMIASAVIIVSTTLLYFTTLAGLSYSAATLRRYLDTLHQSYCVGQWAPPRTFWHEMDARPLPPCTMDTCFNISRCADAAAHPAHVDELKVYIYKDAGFSHPPYYFEALLESPRVTHDPRSACILLVLEPFEFYGLAHPRPKFSSLPYWNGGLNHAIVSLADNWPSDLVADPSSLGMASLAASYLQQASFRPGFDVAIPLPGLAHFGHLASLPPHARKYLLTFKGTRYIGNKEGNFRSDPSFRSMHNGRDVIVVVSCGQETNEKIGARCPHLKEGCEEDEAVFREYGYEELMNTTFGLAPAGRSSSSFRIVEVMSAGAIPVIVADNYVEPLERMQIEWGRCAVRFGTREMARIVGTLRGMERGEVESRQAYCRSVYEDYLKDNATLVDSVLRALSLRLL